MREQAADRFTDVLLEQGRPLAMFQLSIVDLPSLARVKSAFEARGCRVEVDEIRQMMTVYPEQSDRAELH